MIDVVYHTGFLVIDRDLRGEDGQFTEEVDTLNERALKMMRASAQGKVLLYQRRLSDGVYEYHARAVRGA